MILGGSIKAKGPELRKSETLFEKKHMEFFLKTEEAKNPEIENFSVWARICDEDVIIEHEGMDQDILLDSFFVEIKDEKDNSVSLTLSVKQVTALKQIFEHYLEAYYAIQALKQPKKIDIV